MGARGAASELARALCPAAWKAAGGTEPGGWLKLAAEAPAVWVMAQGSCRHTEVGAPLLRAVDPLQPVHGSWLRNGLSAARPLAWPGLPLLPHRWWVWGC